MTYCLAISLREGLVFTSDSRTNAGVDHVSTYSKMHTFGIDGERQFVLLSAGNLATTQSVVSQLRRDIKMAAPLSLYTVADMREAADYVGSLNVAQQARYSGGGAFFEASFILGGQIRGERPELYLVYAQGNHITTACETTYLQIGESKYGKPILDRILKHETALDTAAVCSLVSMDSTQRSNITVGPPIELLIYRENTLVLEPRLHLDENSEYLRALKSAWDQSLKDAFVRLPPLPAALTVGPGQDQQPPN